MNKINYNLNENTLNQIYQIVTIWYIEYILSKINLKKMLINEE